MNANNQENTDVYEQLAADGGQRYSAAFTLSDLLLMLKDGQAGTPEAA